jgi:predicted XRE-type DNA-binding protein
MMKDDDKITPSSGNVFADLGLPDADQLLVKADLAIEITRVVEERGLTQAQAAEILGVDQPKVSALVRGRLDGFSLERLYRFLNALGRDVEIVVRATPRGRREPGVTVRRVSARAEKPTARTVRKSTLTRD